MEKLYVITPIFNPAGYASRYALYWAFAQYLQQFKNVVHCTVELSSGKFYITDPSNPNHVQVYGDEPIWYKENLINIGVASLPKDAKYIAWIDPDVIFTNPYWADETIALLKQNPIVQLYSTNITLDANYERVYEDVVGLAKALDTDPKFKSSLVPYMDGSWFIGHPGFAWASTMDWWRAVGGLLDICICGSADSYISRSVLGRVVDGTPEGNNCIMTSDWYATVREYEARCQAYNQVDTIPYINNMVIHYWHGSLKDRNYDTRHNILKDYGYSPSLHVYKNKQGVIQLRGCEDLKQILQAYFNSRNEDGKTVEEEYAKV